MQSGFLRILMRVLLSVLLAAALSGAALPVQAAAELPKAASALQIQGPYATVRSSGAQAYAGPGVGFWSLGRLRANAIVPIVGVSADRQFWQVNTVLGLVWVRDADVIATNADGVPVVEVGSIGRTVVNSAVRAGPSTQAARLAILPRGSQFYIIGTNADGTWLNIRYRFGEGWVATVNTDRASSTAPRTPSAGTPAPGLPRADIPRAIVNTGALNLRSGPGVFFTSIGVLAQGESLPILARTSDDAWLLVQSRFGRGWLDARLVRTTNYLGNVPIIRYADAAANGVIAATTINATNLRAGPSVTFNVIAVIPPGTQVTLLGQSRNRAWWFVGTPLGKGWVSKETVRTLGGTSLVPVLP